MIELWRKQKHLLIFFLISVSLTMLWFREGNILGGGETGAPFYNLKRMSDISNFTWGNQALGGAPGLTIAGGLFWRSLALLQTIDISGFLLQGSLFFLMLFLTLFSMYVFSRELFPRFSPNVWFLASLFYLFNPYSLMNIWNRFLLNTMLFYALLPFTLWLFIKGVEERKYKYAILLQVIVVMFAYAFGAPAQTVLFWALLLAITFYYIFITKRVYPFKFFSLNLLIFLLFNFWWFSQEVYFRLSPAFKTSQELFFSTIGNQGTLDALSKSLGQLTNLFVLQHGTFFSQQSSQLPFSWPTFYIHPLALFLQWIVVLAVLGITIKRRKEKWIVFLLTIFILGVFVAKGNSPPFGEIFNVAFNKVSFFQFFRNPFEKLGILIPLAFSPLFGVSILEVKNLVISRWGNTGGRWVIIVSFIYLMVFFAFPFWTGLVFSSGNPPANDPRVGYQVAVPKYYEEADEWLSNQKGEFRFVALPLGGEGIFYNWPKGYVGVEQSGILFSTPGISYNTTIPFYHELVSALSRYQLEEEFFVFAPFINVRYVIWRSDIDFKRSHMANPGTIKEKLEEWVDEGLLKKRFEAGELTVYEVNEKFFWPKIYTTNNLFVTNETDLTKVTDFSRSFPEKKVVIVKQESGLKRNVPYQKLILTPEEVFLQIVTAPIPKDLTEEDLLSRLFHAQHLPDTWYYPLIRLKEKLEEVSEKDYFGWILYRNGILGKRAVEVYKLRGKDADQNTILRAENDYKKELERMSPEILKLIGTDTPVSRVVRDSLVYQWVLLDRSGSLLADPLSEVLVHWGFKPKFELPVADKDYAIFSFEVPFSGEFELNIDRFPADSKLYLDGKVVSGKIRDEQILKLDSGEHELAFLTANKTILLPYLEQEEAIFSNKNLPSWQVDIPDLPTTYQIGFDYRFVRGEGFELEFVQDIDSENSPIFSGGIFKDEFYHGWRHWESEFTTAPGADWGILRTIPTEEEVCRRAWLVRKVCEIEKQDFEVEIRNLRVSEANLPDAHLVLARSQVMSMNTKVEFSKVDLTEYKVKVSKEDDTPEMLVFSELFNSDWEVRLEDGTKIPEDKHFLVNVYANGWLIDKSGDSEITLKFAPQELLEIGKKVSAVSIFAGLVFLGVSTWRGRRKDD